MAHIQEVDNSRGGSEDKGRAGTTLMYAITGTQDDAAVRNLIRQTAPASVGNYRYAGFKFRKTGYDVWSATVTYEIGSPRDRQPPEPGTARINFSTSGETQHVTYALNTKPYPKELPAAETGKLIHYDGKNVKGIDVPWPALTFNIDYTIPGNGMTPEYLYTVFSSTAKTNSAAWKGFLKEEVLFLGIDGTIDFGKDTTLSYKFAVSFEETNKTIGGIPGIKKPGFHYAWANTLVTTSENRPAIVTDQVNVDQVYETVNFNNMAIPIGTIIQR